MEDCAADRIKNKTKQKRAETLDRVSKSSSEIQGSNEHELTPWGHHLVSWCNGFQSLCHSAHGFKSLRDSYGVGQLSPAQCVSGLTGPPVCMLWGSRLPQRNIDVLLPEKKDEGRQRQQVSAQRPCMKRFQPPYWPTSQDSQHMLSPLLYHIPHFFWFVSCSLWDALPAYLCMFP